MVEYYWLEGHYDRTATVLADMIKRRVSVIATPGSDPVSLAAKAATATIPIVFGVAKDPVAMGLVASLARPGGNATGINFFAHEIDAKLAPATTVKSTQHSKLWQQAGLHRYC